MAILPDDLRNRFANSQFRTDEHRAAAKEVIDAMEILEKWRKDLLRESFTGTLDRLINTLAHAGPTTREQAEQMANWLSTASPVIDRIPRGAGFWIDLMLSDLPSPTPLPPDGRVIDV